MDSVSLLDVTKDQKIQNQNQNNKYKQNQTVVGMATKNNKNNNHNQRNTSSNNGSKVVIFIYIVFMRLTYFLHFLTFHEDKMILLTTLINIWFLVYRRTSFLRLNSVQEK